MFTISVSLVAVFIPLLLMGGIVGRLFREFAVTLSIAITVSMVISLTVTPMMCAHLLNHDEKHGWLYKKTEQGFQWIVDTYAATLTVALRFAPITLLVLLIHDRAQRVPVHPRSQAGFSRSRTMDASRVRFKPTRIRPSPRWTAYCGA